MNDAEYWKKRVDKIKRSKVLNGHDENWNNREKFKRTLSQFTQK